MEMRGEGAYFRGRAPELAGRLMLGHAAPAAGLGGRGRLVGAEEPLEDGHD